MNKLCETKPNSEIPKMTITIVMTTTNNYEQPTMNYSKQTQTNPILPAFAGKIALPALECHYRGSKVEGPVVINLFSIFAVLAANSPAFLKTRFFNPHSTAL
jgi:hypothetical protein